MTYQDLSNTKPAYNGENINTGYPFSLHFLGIREVPIYVEDLPQAVVVASASDTNVSAFYQDCEGVKVGVCNADSIDSALAELESMMESVGFTEIWCTPQTLGC